MQSILDLPAITIALCLLPFIISIMVGISAYKTYKKKIHKVYTINSIITIILSMLSVWHSLAFAIIWTITTIVIAIIHKNKKEKSMAIVKQESLQTKSLEIKQQRKAYFDKMQKEKKERELEQEQQEKENNELLQEIINKKLKEQQRDLQKLIQVEKTKQMLAKAYEKKQQKIYDNQNFKSKNALTKTENKFFDKLLALFEKDYLVQCQVGLVTLLDINDKYFRMNYNKLHKYIDFGLFSKKTRRPVIMIELNDYTHKAAERAKRDSFVKETLKTANIPLVTFYADRPNESWYIKKRILTEIENHKRRK